MTQNDAFSNWVRTLTFDHWSTSRHAVDVAVFLNKRAAGEAVLLDVRTDEETRFVALPQAIHIPINQLPDRLDEIPRDKLVVTFCSGGDRANVAYAYLHAQGFDNVRIMARGGYATLMGALMPGAIRKLLAKEG